MLVFLSLCVIFLNLISVPIRVGFNFYLDFFGNVGFIKVYLFGIRVFFASVHFEHDESYSNNIIIKHGKKVNKLHINVNSEDKKSVAAIVKKPFFSNVSVEKISVHFTAGKNNDAFFTVALIQSVKVFFYSALSALKCKYDVKITESFTPQYDRNVLQSDFIGIIAASIADIIVSLFTHLIGAIKHKAAVRGKKREAIV